MPILILFILKPAPWILLDSYCVLLRDHGKLRGLEKHLLVIGVELAWALKDTDTPATVVSRGLVIYSAAPVTALLMLIYSVELIVKQIVALGGKQE
jgi:hypothetical protein